MLDVGPELYRSIAWAIDPLNLGAFRDDFPTFYDGLIELGLLPLEIVERSMEAWMDTFSSGTNRGRIRSDLVAIASQVRHLAARASD